MVAAATTFVSWGGGARRARMLRWRLFLAILCASAASPALGATPEELAASGRYEEAIRAGTDEGGSVGYEIAARAALADAITRSSPCFDCLERTEALARKVIAADSRSVEGHVELAVVLGYEARFLGDTEALARDIPGRTKREIDAALAINPHHAWALSALGGWNIEIVRGGGELLANWLYGASEDAGMSAFAAALKAAPNDFNIQYHYALLLSAYDLVRFRRQVEGALSRIATEDPKTASEKVMRDRADTLLVLLRKDDLTKLRVLVRAYLGYP